MNLDNAVTRYKCQQFVRRNREATWIVAALVLAMALGLLPKPF